MNPSLVQLAAKVGKTAYLWIDELKVEVTVLDVKQAWGRVRYLVTPTKGEGEKWTEYIEWIKEGL
jgi:hypothetical protein